MTVQYSKEPFEDYTHRFIVKFSVDDDFRNDTNITLYSNSDSYKSLRDFVDEKKSNKVISFNIFHRVSKEQDEMTSKFIDDFLKDL